MLQIALVKDTKKIALQHTVPAIEECALYVFTNIYPGWTG